MLHYRPLVWHAVTARDVIPCHTQGDTPAGPMVQGEILQLTATSALSGGRTGWPLLVCSLKHYQRMQLKKKKKRQRGISIWRRFRFSKPAS